MNEMQWRSAFGGDTEKILHLCINGQWLPYTKSQLAVPDYPIPGGSKGWATYQKLMKAGWTLVPSEKVNQEEAQVS